ncbi:MAG: N-6 DNA methylase [Anaerolineae bacterium]
MKEYTLLLQREEGRPLTEYVMVVWDGSHISFGYFQENGAVSWERLSPFNVKSAFRLLQYLKANGAPLVHPQLLSQMVGPESDVGTRLIPRLFQAVRKASASSGTAPGKTRLLFLEWKRLFGQVVGIQSEQMRALIQRQAEAHQQPYTEDVSAYLFALNTYIALIAKLVAALSLPQVSQDLAAPDVPIEQKIAALESGQLFLGAGVSNMLIGDFFSWYRDDPDWPLFRSDVDRLVMVLSGINFDMTRKDPATIRDLFKGMYQTFVPRALRHALGEYYTPDWLAAYVLDQLGWSPQDELLDPTCGTGTFLLEALRRRMMNASGAQNAHDFLAGLYGVDLNPLAVLAARASLLVFLSPYLNPQKPIRLPIFLADAMNTASVTGSICQHTILTELGPIQFSIPQKMVADPQFYEIMMRVRDLVEAGYPPADQISVLAGEFDLALSPEEEAAFRDTLNTLVRLHQQGWDTIWTAVLADRFASAVIPPVRFIAGNPPWVKWSHLPPEYASFIKERCLRLGVFSQDRWVGGIESDISTIITYEVMDKWLSPGGRLAFLITGTVFFNESSQGFRRFHLQHRCLRAKVIRVEDFSEIAPFEGVSNFPVLLLLERDGATEYPVPYRVWKPPLVNGRAVRGFPSAAQFLRNAVCEEYWAAPVPGTDNGPWLRGTLTDHHLWRKIFGRGRSAYVARKGVTTDCNGVFFVRILQVTPDRQNCQIQNEPTLGKRLEIPQVTEWVESEHLFPLLRGRNVAPFSAHPDPQFYLLLPQRGMHGDPDLPKTAPKTYRFLSRFKTYLERRSSYRRYQKGKPFWSVWSTGPYTFSKYKVVWRELAGGKFSAAYIGSLDDPILGEKVVVPDHKLYFIPVETEDEAAYLTAFLNAPMIARAVSAYAAQLSLGTSVAEYLNIPAFDPSDPFHLQLAKLAQTITAQGGQPSPDQMDEIDRLVGHILDLKSE